MGSGQVNVDSTQNIISFCTGYAGLELGIERAGVDVRTICFVEREGFCIANLVAKIEEGRLSNAPVWTDLKTFPASDFRGIVDGICCGYPCQPFSSAGKRQGEEDPRHLWPYLRKHIQTIRPSWVFAENVSGHITLGLSTVLSDLAEDGYRCAWGIFSAEEVGAPHQRKRVFILAKLPNARSPYGREVQFTEGRTEEDAKEQKLNSNGNKRGVEQLAHTASREPRQSQARNGGQDTSGGSEETRWPARPGEEQYEWEEPRVTEVIGKLGRTIDGTQHRVDRLRLLGNGVVPQTAELAWKTLWQRI